MDLPTLVLIALALSLDSFAISIAMGVVIRRSMVHQALRIAVVFGAFHWGMLTLGWWSGQALRSTVSGVDHWIAFGLLAAIGWKMIYEASVIGDDLNGPRRTHPSTTVLMVLGIATSIDALAVGISFAFLGLGIIAPAIFIGAVIFTLALAGVFIGSRVGHFFERRVEVVAGFVLIAIGIRILAEHLTS